MTGAATRASPPAPLVNASTWALMLTGRVLDEQEPGIVGHLKAAVRRLGEPVIRAAVARAMKEMGRQFVLGETIKSAMDNARKLEADGYTYSYDMLGEAAKTAADARRYDKAYSDAIKAIAGACRSDDIRANPGISVKLSALHPRYEVAQEARVMVELVPVVRKLALQAAKARMGFNIDAEEADRLTLSLKVIEAVLADPALKGWDGFGIVVQAYGRRAGAVIDWLYALSQRLDRRIMVRLVKGAYWDAEVKRAQVLGLTDFPVFTRKDSTDVSYIANAKKLLGMTDRIYPQFATHNAHTVAAVLDMAGGQPYEFQRLHGMGERLHDIVHRDARHPLPHLRPRRRAPRPARLPRPPPAGERREQQLRQPDRQRGCATGGGRRLPADSRRGNAGCPQSAHPARAGPVPAGTPEFARLRPDRRRHADPHRRRAWGGDGP